MEHEGRQWQNRLGNGEMPRRRAPVATAEVDE